MALTSIMPMSTERNKLILDLYLQASELTFSQRDSFLRTRCGQDKELYQEVFSLLKYSSPGLRTGGISTQIMAIRPGERIGRYVVLGSLGAGGMGDVYIALQDQPERKVALKVVRTYGHSESTARFRLESRALAVMNHENVAKVFEAGETDDGIPYLALELVLGEPITQFADSRSLPIRDRIQLLVQVCGAIGHIHQKGVIHRDIKPANIVVDSSTNRPVPKVIDFGIAKAIDHQLGTVVPTIGNAFLGTLEYSSPEQLIKNRADIRSDVYSLGVVLYELLVGRPPFRLNDYSGLVPFSEDVAKRDPVVPSRLIDDTDISMSEISTRRRTTPRRLRKLLCSEPDCIVTKALDKDPERRYQSAVDLQQDLKRYLDGRPTIAHPPSKGYRIKKTIVRHRDVSIALAITILALFTGIVTTAWQARQAALNLAELERLATVLISSLNEIADVPGAIDAKQRLVTTATETLDEIQHRTANPDLQELLATAYERLGQLRADPYSSSIGDTRGGLMDLDKAVELREQICLRQPSSVNSALKLMQCYLMQVIVMQSGLSLGKDPVAILNNGIEIGHRLLATDSTNAEVARVQSLIKDRLATYSADAGLWDEAVDYAQKAYELRKTVVVHLQDHMEAERLLGVSYRRLGYYSQDPVLEKGYAFKALELHESHYQKRPFSYRVILELSFTYRNAGYALCRNGEVRAALPYFRRFYHLRQIMAFSDSMDVRSQDLFGRALHTLGTAFITLGQADSALYYHERGLRIRLRIHARDPRPAWSNSSLAASNRGMARANRAAKQYQTADQYYSYIAPEEGINISSPLWGLFSWRDLVERAHSQWEAGNVERAAELLTKSADLVMSLEDRLRDQATSMISFGDLSLAYVHLAQALSNNDTLALELLRRAYRLPFTESDYRPVHIVVTNELACKLADSGHLIEAEQCLKEIRDQISDETQEHIVTWNLATVIAERDRCDEARALIRSLNCTALLPCSAVFRTEPYDWNADPYSRLHIERFRMFPVWGENPTPALRQRVPQN